MLLFPRSWTRRSLNSHVFFGALLGARTAADTGAFRAADDGTSSVTPFLEQPSVSGLIWAPGSLSLQKLGMVDNLFGLPSLPFVFVCWCRLLFWRRFCLATREPWELPPLLLLLFFFFWFSAVELARLRFLARTEYHMWSCFIWRRVIAVSKKPKISVQLLKFFHAFLKKFFF